MKDTLTVAAQGDALFVAHFHTPPFMRHKLFSAFDGGILVGGKDSPRFEALNDLDTARLEVRLKPSAKGRATTDNYVVDLALHFPDASTAEIAANEFLKMIQGKLQNVLRRSGMSDELVLAAIISPKLTNEIESALRAATIECKGPVVQVHMEFRIDMAAEVEDWMTKGIVRVAQAKEQIASANNLRQLALAMHTYADTYDRLPPAVVYSEDGKTPLYSWRVVLLPFVEEDELYKQFHLDEPWDSARNLPLLKKMPKLYASPRKIEGQEPFQTFYQVFVGPEKEAPFEGNRLVRFPGSFADGTSNTLLVVEAGEAVPWTKPVDIPYANNRPLPKLGGIFKDGFNACTADGAPRFLRRDISEKTLRALITPDGGELLPPDWDQP